MSDLADTISDCYQARLKAIEFWDSLQRTHKARRFLSTLDFTDAQLAKYNQVVTGINTRLKQVLTRKRR